MEQSYYAPSAPAVSAYESTDAARDSLESAAADFSKNVQEATGKLVAAAESFGSMSSGLSKAVDEVKTAASRAEEAQKAAEEAKAAAEAVQARMDRDYSNLKGLMNDLQERIGALAVLARPFNLDSEPGAPAAQDESATENSSDTENSSEGSSEESAPAAENAPSPAGWQGWQG